MTIIPTTGEFARFEDPDRHFAVGVAEVGPQLLSVMVGEYDRPFVEARVSPVAVVNVEQVERLHEALGEWLADEKRRRL